MYTSFQIYFPIQYFTMDPECSLQDVVRCHLCETPEPPLHCDVCDNHVCKDCEEKHCSEESKIHKMVPFKFRRCITKCQKHSSELCERYCEQCKITVCCFTDQQYTVVQFLFIDKMWIGWRSFKVLIISRSLNWELSGALIPVYTQWARLCWMLVLYDLYHSPLKKLQIKPELYIKC